MEKSELAFLGTSSIDAESDSLRMRDVDGIEEASGSIEYVIELLVRAEDAVPADERESCLKWEILGCNREPSKDMAEIDSCPSSSSPSEGSKTTPQESSGSVSLILSELNEGASSIMNSISSCDLSMRDCFAFLCQGLVFALGVGRLCSSQLEK